ncbi:variant erythrocyte surface antigen-1 alpha subunit [Babesia bovis T2Bo]|uniref:Variant erythrocyte surface antigen-1, putative n=1 Tax=Babesia bovis TaxID=5865 RepID=A7AXH5_BABBO|nr:variant erythrocyte surface antigen-1 alpha subunit [Babesia bovis T2Bo]KAG6440212.1 variant erythrocyte surface antigen-1 alpha subunit [Babesia bovis T2Bo]|eukprot:XP_001608629.1 variant erythrocyte surface antigen-1 [Babesia bovis T2Bo]
MSSFKPYSSLTDAPTNLKEAIDWVLRVTGKDGKALNKETECICGLAAAVTDLLQSVQLEYNGYEGDVKNGADANKGPPKERVTECLNGLFSLVQGLGGAAVVRTYIDQLAQVLSALVGWSKIVTCGNSECNGGGGGNQHGKDGSCKYLKDVEENKPCETCGCMKWDVADPNSQGTPLGRKCQRCSDSGGSSAHRCDCSTGDSCSAGKECKCAEAGKCCKCCCKEKCGNCKKECSCVVNDKNDDTKKLERHIHKDSYQSAYGGLLSFESYVGGTNQAYRQPIWNDLSGILPGDKNIIGLLDGTASNRRHHCARILLGSVCLIWSGLTYMYWTGKYHKSSPRWNNHILDGSGLDDGTLSQWLQALGFPRGMINNSGPRNRWDAIIWDGHRDKLYLGFPDTGNNSNAHGHDNNANTFRNPAGMNYAGYIHTLEKGAFCSNGNVFPKNADDSSTSDTNIHKCGALIKLYILSCAYFTGLQKKRSTQSNTPTTPKTIREILYWLSALPYSPAYPLILEHGKNRLTEVTKKTGDTASTTEQSELKFHQTGRNHPITVHEFNLFAHFQAVTQYCPLVLIGIQGGIHSATKGTDTTKEPAIHSLYSNSHFSFTYPSVDIQAYNQVVHYIRGLFYQLYFLRKQCAVKVALGGKWRECRYGNGVLGKNVVSWMCLGCDPMEHDRKGRVEKVNGEILKGVKTGGDPLAGALKTLLEKIGEVVVQLGNAQEALEGKKPEAILGVKAALEKAKQKLEEAKGKLGEAKTKLGELTNGGGGGILKNVEDKLGELTKGDSGALHTLANGGNTAGSLQQVSSSEHEWEKDYSSAKDKISEVIHKIQEVLNLLKEWAEKKQDDDVLNVNKGALLDDIKKLQDICNCPKCPPCHEHANKCGRQPQSKYCDKCHQQYMDGFPSPLQAFLEDRLPGFSCDVVRNNDSEQPYPPAASHLGHCNGSGQCCPLPMGFRGQFYSGSTSDMTGSRLYGILYFFSNENMMQSCVYTLVRVTAALSATTPQVLGDVFGFFRGGIGEKERGKNKQGTGGIACKHEGDPSTDTDKSKYFCGWCASGLRDVVKKIEWIPNGNGTDGGSYRGTLGKALIEIKGEKGSSGGKQPASQPNTTALSRLTKNCQYLSPLTGELYTAVSATFGHVYLSWVLYLSDALHSGLESLSDAFKQIECRGCRGCDPNKCKKGSHGVTGGGLCGCQSIVSCTGVLPVLYRHGFSYGNPFNLEGFQQGDGKTDGQYDITKAGSTKKCHEFLESLNKVLEDKQAASNAHPLSNLLTQVGKLQYDIRLPWIFVLTVAWLVAVLYLAFGAIWPLDWAHMRSHWLRGGEHQWQCMWYKVMTGRKGMELVEYFGKT